MMEKKIPLRSRQGTCVQCPVYYLSYVLPPVPTIARGAWFHSVQRTRLTSFHERPLVFSQARDTASSRQWQPGLDLPSGHHTRVRNTPASRVYRRRSSPGVRRREHTRSWQSPFLCHSVLRVSAKDRPASLPRAITPSYTRERRERKSKERCRSTPTSPSPHST